jgi:hypothetical protein
VTARRPEAILGALVAEELGVKTQRPAGKSATESVRGKTTTSTPGRQRREGGALLEGLREELVRIGQGLAPRETEDDRAVFAEAGVSTSTILHSIMLTAKVSAGQAAWKLLFRVKARFSGDSRTKQSVGCLWLLSVAEVG